MGPILHSGEGGYIAGALVAGVQIGRQAAAKSRCLSKQFGLAGRAEAGRESRAKAEAREGASMTRNDFAFRIDRWTDDGERIVEHVAGAEDFQIAMATYHAARKRWPKAAMTLRQDTWVIEDSRRTRISTLFRSRGPRRAAKAAGGGDERTKRRRSGRPQLAGGQERRAGKSAGAQAGRSGAGIYYSTTESRIRLLPAAA